MNLQITEVQIIPIKPKDGLVGFASFVLNDAMYLGGIGIYTRPDGGYRLTYPLRNLIYKEINIFYPISKEAGKLIELEVVNKFEEVMNHDRHHNSCS